ncbi:MAG TPA: hypothetical protein VG347_19995 [Verrucomicrobiae bacterium]|nr:hypothetical protein [Verrucomicrobiae bacterium]
MKIIALIGLVLGMMAGEVCGQNVSAADLLKFRFPATNSPETNSIAAVSRVEFTDVPILMGIENLARQAGINYMLEPGLFADAQGDPIREPEISCHWENIAARDALLRLCDEHGLSLVENPYTHIARILRAGQSRHFVDARLLGLSTNTPVSGTKATTNGIPLIQFSDVPLDLAFMNLIRQSGRSIELASNLMDNVGQSIDARGTVTFRELRISPDHGARDHWFKPMPQVSLRCEDITCEQAIVALCENYGLEIVTDAETGNPEIVPRKLKRHHRAGH